MVSSRLYRYDLHDESTIHRRDYPFTRKAIHAYQILFAFLKKNIDLYSHSDINLSNGLKRILESQFVPFSSRVLSSDLSIKEIKTIKKQLIDNGILPLSNDIKKNYLINGIFKFTYIFPLFHFFYQKIFIPYIFPYLNRN